MITCTKCGELKSPKMFCKKNGSKTGYQPACKTCMNIAYTISRKKKQGHYQQIQNVRSNENVRLAREWKSARGCLMCPEREAVCLQLHHPDPSVKEDNPSNLMRASFAAFLAEAEKCVVLCGNCHVKVHYGLISLPEASI